MASYTTKWRCLKFCGACCHLDPSDRPDLEDYLSPAELAQYLSMVGTGGWCIHYDHDTRQCSIYDQRPQFCRVTPANFQRMYGIAPAQFADFANQCCIQQITGVYGKTAEELTRFIADDSPA